MDIRRLRYFVTVAEEQHFTRAARRLGMHQPPLSAQIRALEKEVGAPLFHRGARSVMLTEPGKLLFKEAREILARIDKAEILVQRYVRGETGSIVVGFGGATYLVPIIPAIMRSFLEENPDVTVHPQQSNTFELANALRDGRVDAAFVRPPTLHQDELRFEPVVDEEMIAVLPHGHRLESEETVTLASLTEETFTLPPRSVGPGFYDSLISALHKAGVSPRVGHESSALAAIPSMVAAGFGISVLPQSLSQLKVEHVSYRPIAGTRLHAPIALACRRTGAAPAAQRLLAIARKRVRSNRSSPS